MIKTEITCDYCGKIFSTDEYRSVEWMKCKAGEHIEEHIEKEGWLSE